MSFIPFGPDDSVISSETVTSALWSGNAFNLSGSYFTSSAQESGSSGKFYLNVYQIPFASSGSEVQFSVAYGHISGSGSALFNSFVNGLTPTRDIYGQMRNIVYGDEGSVFNFGGSNGQSRDIYVINVSRARFKESIAVGSWNLELRFGTSSLYLTDNSKDSSITNYIGSNKVYYIVSGSDGSSFNSSSIQTNSGSYGLFLPDMGLYILNPRALSLPYNLGGISMPINETPATTYTASININNRTLYQSIVSGSIFTARNQETISSRFFFVTAKSSQLNYTTNPSIIDNNGNLLYPTLVDNPQTYATTIGLYNDSNELLAVAKLSKPLVKDFTKQLNCRVKLEF